MNPCYKCQNRNITCHANCKEYIEYANECRKANEYNRQKNDVISRGGAIRHRHTNVWNLKKREVD